VNYGNLITRIEIEIEELKAILAKTELFIQQYQLTTDILYQDALGSAIALNLHGFYTGVERIFIAIAQNIDLWQPNREQWHRELLEQMSVDIPAVRPRIISESTRDKLDELRRFRHVVRNIYAYRLETKRVIELATRLHICNQEFSLELEKFITQL